MMTKSKEKGKTLKDTRLVELTVDKFLIIREVYLNLAIPHVF
jgi:hypothetical protein